jgi:hypothetical protein
MMMDAETKRPITEFRDFDSDNPHTSLFLSREARIRMIKAGQGCCINSIQKEIFIQKGYDFIEF